jgi:hypothetical protein
MGERTHDLRDVERPEILEQEVEEIRENMTGIVRELDRRRHQFLDLRGQLRKHAVPLALGALTLALLVGSAAGFSAWRRRERNRPLARARNLRRALSRMIAHPELVAQPRPSIARKALASAASAVAGSLAGSMTDRIVRTKHTAEPAAARPTSRVEE